MSASVVGAGVIPRAWARIDPEALRHNLLQIRALAPGARVMAVIKANGYGHGAVTVARALRELRADDGPRQPGEADAFAVACLEEALALRAARVYAPIVVLEGVLSLEEARLCLRERLQVVVHDRWQLAVMEQLPAAARADLWLKVDTGMRRLGLAPADLPDALARLRARPQWRLCGVMTHLASADEDTGSALDQARCFDEALAATGEAGAALPRSIANSAGVLADAGLHRDWVRPGLLLYGMSPRADRSAESLGLRPAMTLQTRVLSLRDCAEGDAIGYGGSFVCPHPMRIATLAVGYADGFQRALGGRGQVLLHGKRAPVVGRVSMDMTAVDVSHIPEAEVADVVTLWGEGLPAERQAEAAGTIAYELCCGLTQRVRMLTPEAAAEVAALR